MRRAIGTRSKTASAATASGGDTIAPRTNAIGHVKPGIIACVTAATITVVKITRPKARKKIGRALRLNSNQSVDQPPLKSSGGSTSRKMKSGERCGRGRSGTNASAIPPTTKATGYGMSRRLAIAVRTTVAPRIRTSASAAATSCFLASRGRARRQLRSRARHRIDGGSASRRRSERRTRCCARRRIASRPER